MEAKDLKVLLLAIDDKPDNLTSLKAVVSDQLPGAKVLTALNGPKGIELARAEDPDVILLDIVMPGMDGFEVCRRLKADERLASIPVLFLTALRTDRDSRIQALEAGGEGFLSKPLNEMELIAQIRAMAKIKTANRMQRQEKEQLAALVAERTRELQHELTERKQAEEALQESENRFRSVMENMSEGVQLFNAKGDMIYQNAASLRIHRFARQADGMIEGDVLKATWKAWDETGRPLAPDEWPMSRIFRDGCIQDQVLRAQRIETGHEFWASANGTTVYDATGKLVLAFITIRDITEGKRVEAERLKLEAQLQQAQKLESVGRLAGGVAHDFNNMLTVILGNVALAIEQSDPGQPIHTDLEAIRKAANRSADLTRKLLAFARKQVIEPEVLDLNQSVAGIIKLLQRLIGEDISLKWLPEANPWLVRVDPSQIDQVLTNLCINARDAIAGVGNIVIETGNSTLDEDYCAVYANFVPGDYVRISVSDDGHGIDKETQAHIFEPFFTTKGVGEGTGLGLATVYGVVKQSGGFVNVYSEPGRGATFTIYLPRHEGGAEAERTAGAAGPPAGGEETILVVEDEPSILKLTARILARKGYAVLSAKSPGEAIRLASEHAGTIDLLMTDVVMPEMNGRDLASNLQSRYPGLKVLFMSGYTADIIAHQGVLDEGVQFIQKPFAIDDLAAKVREVLDSE